jgi:hypothetical protein
LRYICLGFMEEAKWDRMTENERTTIIDQCIAYDRELRRDGRFLGGEALQSSSAAATLTDADGEVVVTDGPFSEAKEQLGGFFLLEADDLNHAIQIMSKHPGVRMGPFEIRPIDEAMSALGRD